MSEPFNTMDDISIFLFSKKYNELSSDERLRFSLYTIPVKIHEKIIGYVAVKEGVNSVSIYGTI